MAIIASVPLFFIVSVVNLLFPEALATIVYITLSTIGLMMSNENNEKYLDKQTGMFNQYGLGLVNAEYIAQKKTEVLLVMTLSEADKPMDRPEWKEYVMILKKIQRFCKKQLKRNTYRVGDNSFVVFAPSEQAAVVSSAAIKNFIDQCRECKVVFAYQTVDLNQYKSNDELMSEIVNISTGYSDAMSVYDMLTGVYNRNEFEKTLEQMQEDKVDAFCFIVGINHLRATNDVMGYYAGDELLQAMAGLLRKTAGGSGKVFRYGGGKFAVLWEGTDAGAFLEHLEKNKKELNKERTVPLSFETGYGRILDANGVHQANKMMYNRKAKAKKWKKKA